VFFSGARASVLAESLVTQDVRGWRHQSPRGRFKIRWASVCILLLQFIDETQGNTSSSFEYRCSSGKSFEHVIYIRDCLHAFWSNNTEFRGVCVFRHRESTSCHSDFDWRAIRWRRQRETGCLPSLQLQSRWDTVIISLELHKKCYFCFIHILNELIFILSCLFELKVPL